MAILVLSARHFGLLLREAVSNPNELKIKRMIDRSLTKKNEHNTLRINLSVEDLAVLNGLIYEYDLVKRGLDNVALAAALDEYALKEHAVEGTPPFIAYSLSEWKAIVEIATQQDSSIDLEALDAHLLTVQYNLESMVDLVKPLLLDMMQRGYDAPPKIILAGDVEQNRAPAKLILPPGM